MMKTMSTKGIFAANTHSYDLTHAHTHYFWLLECVLWLTIWWKAYEQKYSLATLFFFSFLPAIFTSFFVMWIFVKRNCNSWTLKAWHFLCKFVPQWLITVYASQVFGCVCVCASSSFFNGMCYKSSLAILNGVNIILCYLAKAFFGFVWFDEFGFVIPSFRATFYSHLHSHTWIIRFNAAYWISLH